MISRLSAAHRKKLTTTGCTFLVLSRGDYFFDAPHLAASGLGGYSVEDRDNRDNREDKVMVS